MIEEQHAANVLRKPVSKGCQTDVDTRALHSDATFALHAQLFQMQKEATTGSARKVFLQQEVNAGKEREVAQQQQLIKAEDDLAASISLLSDLSCEIARLNHQQTGGGTGGCWRNVENIDYADRLAAGSTSGDEKGSKGEESKGKPKVEGCGVMSGRLKVNTTRQIHTSPTARDQGPAFGLPEQEHVTLQGLYAGHQVRCLDEIWH